MENFSAADDSTVHGQFCSSGGAEAVREVGYGMR